MTRPGKWPGMWPRGRQIGGRVCFPGEPWYAGSSPRQGTLPSQPTGEKPSARRRVMDKVLVILFAAVTLVLLMASQAR
jgi:hypothetical protein